MGLRFRRSIKILPGLRLNLGMKGASVTVGGRGATVNIGPNGTYANLGLPGTGISYRERLDSPQKGKPGTRYAEKQNAPLEVEIPSDAHFEIEGDDLHVISNGERLPNQIAKIHITRNWDQAARTLQDEADRRNENGPSRGGPENASGWETSRKYKPEKRLEEDRSSYIERLSRWRAVNANQRTAMDKAITADAWDAGTRIGYDIRPDSILFEIVLPEVTAKHGKWIPNLVNNGLTLQPQKGNALHDRKTLAACEPMARLADIAIAAGYAGTVHINGYGQLGDEQVRCIAAVSISSGQWRNSDQDPELRMREHGIRMHITHSGQFTYVEPCR